MEPYSDQYQDLSGFTIGFTVSQILGVLCIVLVAVWTDHFLGGFAGQSNPGLEFNFHPLFMVIGLIFLYGDAIMVYRVMRNERKTRLKWLHGALHFLAFVFAVIALKTVFDSHNLKSPPVPNMYTLHSWMGLTTVLLFTLQLASGFISFLFPGLRRTLRAKYLPLHIYFGVAIFAMAVATALMGITEKLLWSLKDRYQTFPSEGVLANVLGLTLVTFALLVVYIVTKSSYRRLPLPEEATLALEPQSPMN